jgi:hypothetical protein
MSTASVWVPSCAASGPAKEAESGQWSDHVISGCISMGLWSRRAARPVGCSCRRSIRKPSLWRWPPSQKSRGWGQTSTLSWSWIRLAGTRVQRSRFLRGCICSFSHRIRQSCSPQNACGPSQMNRSPIESSLRLTNWNRSKANGAAGSKLIQRSFEVELPFIGGLLL